MTYRLLSVKINDYEIEASSIIELTETITFPITTVYHDDFGVTPLYAPFLLPAKD